MTDLVKRLRDLGDHASFEPHMHHTAADRIEELEAEVVKAREEGRRAGLEEAAALAEKMDGEWFQNTYRASYHKKRYMAAEVEWMTRKPLHILSEDITDAIRALIPPAGGEE